MTRDQWRHVESYIRKIHDSAAREYAQAYLDWVIHGSSGSAPEPHGAKAIAIAPIIRQRILSHVAKPFGDMQPFADWFALPTR